MNRVSKIVCIASFGVIVAGCPGPTAVVDGGHGGVDTGAIDSGAGAVDSGAIDMGLASEAGLRDAGTVTDAGTDASMTCTAAQYRNAAGVCTALTACTATQYESTAPTATTDRVCMPLTVCTATQYESTAATATSNRVCMPLTVCTATQYESTAATATTDRVCMALAVCTATQYESMAPTATSNRVCSNLAVCTAAQYEMVAPTATSDRVCAPLTVCTAAQYQTVAPTATSDRVCSALTNCVAGQFVMTAPTATTNRVCAPCGASSYSTTANAASCTAWTVCTNAQLETTAPSATVNRVCTACGAGTLNCDLATANMCEINSTNDHNNCGGCGTVCPAAQACVRGACQVVSRYVATPSPAGVAFIDACAAAGAETILAGADDSSLQRPLPFAFNYFGTALAAAAPINITSNGWIGMDGVNNASLGGSIPSAGTPNAVVAPYWGDNYNQRAPQCLATVGAAPNRRWVLEWDRSSHCCGGDPANLTYEVIFTEGTNTIDFVYGTMSGARGQTVGIENQAGTAGVGGCPGGGFSCAPASNSSVRFTPLYHGYTVPALPALAGCDASTYTQVATTDDGGYYGYNTGDSVSCRAWKLAASICTTAPVDYFSSGTQANFSCANSGGFTDANFGMYCAVANQYSCSGCPGACNASCRYNPLSLRNCSGGETNQP